jgi:hypothetical protein
MDEGTVAISTWENAENTESLSTSEIGWVQVRVSRPAARIIAASPTESASVAARPVKGEGRWGRSSGEGGLSGSMERGSGLGGCGRRPYTRFGHCGPEAGIQAPP